MRQALLHMRDAAAMYERCEDSYRLPIAQARVAGIEGELAALQR
jgi:hypothetical protein